MRISIFGLGYVGIVSAGCLASDGHEIVGVDPNKAKVGLINVGKSPIVEKDIEEMIARAVRSGGLRATSEAYEAVINTEISLICVGTPSQLNGNLDLSYVRRVCEEIGSALRDKRAFHIVVVRSTMLPGSMREVVIPMLEEHSGKRAGVHFGVCINPEFLREGTAVYDFYHPPKTVIGEEDPKVGDYVVELYKRITAPLIRTDMETAEMLKYADNVWHALKVVFANEIGSLAKALGVDGCKVMEIFCQDTKLNLSPCYLKPGFAFGGSCLPKDLRALTYKAKTVDLELPVLNAIWLSNQRHIEKALAMIVATGKRKIGVLGFAFKAGTDDLRESPMVTLVERLLGKGYELRLYDRCVNLAALAGANRDYLFNHIPYIQRLMVSDLEAIFEFAEVLVIGQATSGFRQALTRRRPGQVIIDLVRIADDPKGLKDYEGICW